MTQLDVTSERSTDNFGIILGKNRVLRLQSQNNPVCVNAFYLPLQVLVRQWRSQEFVRGFPSRLGGLEERCKLPRRGRPPTHFRAFEIKFGLF